MKLVGWSFSVLAVCVLLGAVRTLAGTDNA
jgi:hypothetical protein